MNAHSNFAYNGPNWKQLKYSSISEGVNKIMFVFVSSRYGIQSISIKEQLLIHVTSWTNFQNIILSERSIYTVILYDSIIRNSRASELNL